MFHLPGFLLLVAGWLQPLHVLPWISWHSEILGFAAIVWFFLIELNSQNLENRNTFVFPKVVIAPLVFALLVLIQYGVGLIHFFGDALTIVFYLAVSAMALTVGFRWEASSLFQQKSKAFIAPATQLAIAILSGAVISTGISLIQSFDVWGSAEWVVRLYGFRRPGANFGQPNHLATLVLMGLVSLHFLYEKEYCSSLFASFLLVFLALGLAITESRAGLLSAAALSLWWAYGSRTIKFRATRAAVLAAWMILLLTLWLWPRFITFVQAGGAGGVFNDARMNTSAGSRLVFWPQLIEAVMQRPWFGWGLRNVSEAHNAVLHNYLQSEAFSYAHNIVLDLAIGFGLPIAALVSGLFGYWGWRRMTNRKTSVSWYYIAFAIPMTVHSMLEFPFSYAYFLFPLMLMWGMLEATAKHDAVWLGQPQIIKSGSIILILLMIWSAIEYVSIEEDFRVARFEALRIGQTPSDYTRPTINLLTQLEAMLLATRIVPSTDMSTADIDLLHRATLRFPWSAIQNRYALSLALNGNPDEAIRQMRVMRALHGSLSYAQIKESWTRLAAEKYPQLQLINLP